MDATTAPGAGAAQEELLTALRRLQEAARDGVIPETLDDDDLLTLLADAGGAPAAQLRWWIDDRPIGSGARAQWLPWPGRHVVQLRDAQGRVHDERRIQVRGAVAKTAPPRKPP